MRNSWAIWNIMKCRFAGFGDGKDLLGHLNPASASSGLAPRVMCWTLRKSQAAKSFVKSLTLVPGEKWKSPNLVNRLQVMECQENLIVSPSPHQTSVRSQVQRVRAVCTTWIALGMGTVHHLESIGNAVRDCTAPGQHWDQEWGVYTTWIASGSEIPRVLWRPLKATSPEHRTSNCTS